MNAAELRKKSPEELKDMLLELNKDQFRLRMQKGTGQLAKPSEMNKVRRNIARIKTVMSEKATGKN